MRLVRITLILAIFLLLGQYSYVFAGDDLELTISFDKAEYKTSDQISVDFILKNKGKEALYINKRFFLNSQESDNRYREVYLSVISPSGEKLPCKVSTSEVGLPKTDYFVLLGPGEEVNLDRKRSIKYYFDFSAPGVYKIKAVYQNVYGEEIGIDAFKDKVESDTVKIKIVE